MSGKYHKIRPVLCWVALVKNKPSCTCCQVKDMLLLFNVLSALEVWCVSLLLFLSVPDYRAYLSRFLLTIKKKQAQWNHGIPRRTKTSVYQIPVVIWYVICNFLSRINWTEFRVFRLPHQCIFQMCPGLIFACTECDPCVRSELLIES